MRRYYEDAEIDDSAARNRPGATLGVPEPKFGPWTLRKADGSLWELDSETGEWVPVNDPEPSRKTGENYS